MPSAQTLETPSGTGLWAAVVGDDAALSVPGIPQKGTERFVGADAKLVSGSRVMRNAAALGRTFKELFGSCPVAGGPLEALLVDAFRYTELYASECGFARNSSRLPRRRPRWSLFAEDLPKTSVGPARQLFCAVSGRFAPNHAAVEPRRLLQGKVVWPAPCSAAMVTCASTRPGRKLCASCSSKLRCAPPCPVGIVAF